jgi:hypothetical protein
MLMLETGLESESSHFRRHMGSERVHENNPNRWQQCPLCYQRCTYHSSRITSKVTISQVLGVLSYLTLPTIDDNLHAVVQALHLSLLEFQTTFNANSFLHGMYINTIPIWDEEVLAWGTVEIGLYDNML